MAYTAPAGNAADLDFGASYTAPAGNAADLTFEDETITSVVALKRGLVRGAVRAYRRSS